MALPRVQPIRPTWRKDAFDDPSWLFDVKYDGFRGLCYVEQGRCRLISRNGNTFDRFDVLADQVASLLDVDDAVLDGEIIVTDETGRPQFYEMLRGRQGPVYVAFDIVSLNGDLRPLPLSEAHPNLRSGEAATTAPSDRRIRFRGHPDEPVALAAAIARLAPGAVRCYCSASAACALWLAPGSPSARICSSCWLRVTRTAGWLRLSTRSAPRSKTSVMANGSRRTSADGHAKLTA